MRSSPLLVTLCGSALCLIAMGFACTLNPQPLPPDNPDGSLTEDAGAKAGVFGGEDASTTTNPETGGGAGGDSGSVNDANNDGGDAATSEGGSDASTDGSADASTSD